MLCKHYCYYIFIFLLGSFTAPLYSGDYEDIIEEQVTYVPTREDEARKSRIARKISAKDAAIFDEVLEYSSDAKKKELALEIYNNPDKTDYTNYKAQMMKVIPILGFTQTPYRNPLAQAVYHKDFDFIQFLLDHGADITFKKSGANEKSALTILRQLERNPDRRRDIKGKEYSLVEVRQLKGAFFEHQPEAFTPAEQRLDMLALIRTVKE